MSERRRLLRVLLVAAAASVATAHADTGELERLFALFAAQGERRKDFIERHYSVLFRNPPELRGTLHFRPPALLEREVLAPRKEKVRIEGNQVTLRMPAEDGSMTERRVSLAGIPQLAELVLAMRATLGGDLAALRRTYTVVLEQPLPRWRIAMQPRELPAPDQGRSVAASVQEIVMSGESAEVQRIEFTETTGDRTEIILTPQQ